jgi:hypothetical protein
MKAKHKPVPWTIAYYASAGNESTSHYSVKRGASTIVRTTSEVATEEDEANVMLIVRACNVHEDLLASLRELTQHAERYGGAPKSATKMWDRARAAIAKATGKEETT